MRILKAPFLGTLLGASVTIAFLLTSANAGHLSQRNVVIEFGNAALQGVRDAKLGAAMVSRALAIVHTCMYDAWAAHDEKAVGTQLGGALRRPASERTPANKERAISYAAYRALTDVLPADTQTVYKGLMNQFGYDPSDSSTDIETLTGIGNVACVAVLEFRHHDKSNQLGEMAAAPEETGISEIQSKQGGASESPRQGSGADGFCQTSQS